MYYWQDKDFRPSLTLKHSSIFLYSSISLLKMMLEKGSLFSKMQEVLLTSLALEYSLGCQFLAKIQAITSKKIKH